MLTNMLPLLLTAHLPLADLPDHLARQYILRDWASSPVLQSITKSTGRLCPTSRWTCSCCTKLVNRTLSDRTSRAYRLAPFLTFGGPFQLAS